MRAPTFAVCALTLIASAALAQSNTTQSGDPPSRAARVSALVGHASIQPSGSDEWGDVSLNFVVTTGDRIVTDVAGRLELEIGAMAVRLSENADVTVASLTENVEGAARTMADLAKAGISMKEVTDKLLADGVKLFADAFRTLLDAVGKSAGVRG